MSLLQITAHVLPFTYLIYFLYPSVYPIKGPAISDVIHQENSLVEDNQKQSGSFRVGNVKRAGHPQKTLTCRNQEAKGLLQLHHLRADRAKIETMGLC